MPRYLTDAEVGIEPAEPKYLTDEQVGLPLTMMQRAQKVWDAPTPGGLVDIAKAGYNMFMGPGRALSGEMPVTDENGRTSMDAVSTGVDFARSMPMGGMPSVMGRVARPAPSTKAVKEAADAGYTAARGIDVRINPQAMREFGLQTGQELITRGLDGDVAPTVNTIVSRLSNQGGDYVTGANLINLRTKLNNIAGQKGPDGRPTQEAAAAMIVKGRMMGAFTERDIMAGDAAKFGQVLTEADHNLAASSVANKVDRKLARAEITSGTVNSGENVGNKIRQNLVDFLKYPENSRGLSKAEMDQMRRVVNGNWAENSARWVGNKAGSGFGWVAGGVGYPVAGPWAFLPPAIGSAARMGYNASTQRQAHKLSDMVRSRSPLGMTQSVEDAFAARFPKQVPTGLLGSAGGSQLAPRYGLLGYPQFGALPLAADDQQQY